MNKLALGGLVGGAAVAGFALGAALIDRLDQEARFPQTTIRIGPDAQQGRCRATTADPRLRARPQAPVRWMVVNAGCDLGPGGVVQLRFESLPSPVQPDRPTQVGNIVLAWVLPDAERRVHRYKVWAHFPSNPDNDYELEDPDLEIVMFLTF
jgi:hypothetical protein